MAKVLQRGGQGVTRVRPDPLSLLAAVVGDDVERKGAVTVVGLDHGPARGDGSVLATEVRTPLSSSTEWGSRKESRRGPGEGAVRVAGHIAAENALLAVLEADVVEHV